MFYEKMRNFSNLEVATITKMKTNIIILFFVYFFVFESCIVENDITEVLIFSGSNNHDWEQKTLALEEMFKKSGVFKAEINYKPDTLNIEILEKFDVIVSNWNSWPENDLRWPAELENALIEFIKGGGGFVTFHASTSVFYKWPEFEQISTSAWVDSTWHGKNDFIQVEFTNTDHPITLGLEDFSIFDELWVNAGQNESFEVLATATNADISAKEIENQPAVFVKSFGKGRIFHTILGHDTVALNNPSFQELMLRGTKWASKGK